ncbi:protein LONGIFOLIA 1-like isoform X2 [Bidens hawaiensis]|uniref:protein LONGIFOLIA 1-like isoform X2 n=1 Tax=Bidens hawaiensis TaxID=980011 RepID=UPI00404A9ED3
MSTEVVHTLKEDTQDLHMQLGCMNGLFQLFDRRFLLGQRRESSRHKKLHHGQSNNIKESNNVSKKPKEKHPNTVTKEKHRVSVESSRNSFSSSCSSLDCSKRVQTESSSFCPSNFSEPSSPTLNKKPELSVHDIRDVVKDSMTRKPRVVSVKTVAKNGRKGPTMTHVDSPRPLLQYERKDQNLAKVQENSTLTLKKVKELKDMSRYSYDERASVYKLKSVSNVKERPRLSLDSKQSSLRNRTNAVDQSQSQSQTNEPESNKRLPTSVMARLMGLEVLKSDSLKIKPCVDQSQTHESTSVSRLSRKPVSNALTRIPLEPAPWKQEVKQPVNKKARDGCQSVYGQIEKRLTEVEFKTSGKDLRALKQILEAIQRTKMRLESTEPEKTVVKRVNAESTVITNMQKVKKVNLGRGHARNIKPTEAKAAGSRSPRLQKSKIKNQSNGKSKSTVPNSKTNNNSFKVRNLSEQSDTVSFPSESDASVSSHNEQEVTSKYWTQENKNKYAERLMGYKQMAEQPNPVSVLDAFYTEDTPSPVKNKSYAFKDNEDLCFDEREWSQVGIYNSMSSCSTELTQLSPVFSNTKLENIKQLVHQIQLLDSTINPHEDINEDHVYIKEILSASGFQKNLDLQTITFDLHPTSTLTLINPELFHILEKTKECASKTEKTKRKMIFDTVNDILAKKFSQVSKRKHGIPNVDMLLDDICLEINNLQTRNTNDPYDEVISIITDDINKRTKDWDHKCDEVPALVLDIERLIYKDLIGELVNGEVYGSQVIHERYRKQLFVV